MKKVNVSLKVDLLYTGDGMEGGWGDLMELTFAS